MVGVTILNEFEHGISIASPWLEIGTWLFVIAVFLVIIGVVTSSFWKLSIHILIVSLVSFIVFIIIGSIAPENTETRYQVTVDESVSFVEFMEKYEILEQTGDIFTIRERESENG